MAIQVNLLLLIELAAVVIGSTAFLFYWNRLLASVITFLIRLYTWRVHHAYLTIGSLQISPLAGRVSFKDVEYHSSNISVRALNGHITWRYWKLRVKQEPDSASVNLKRNKLPCRIIVYAKGVECFVYNRTPAYDAIVERIKKHERESEKTRKASFAGEEENDWGLRARLKNLARMSTKGSSTKGALYESENADYSYPPTTRDSYQMKPVKPAASSVDWFREACPLELRIVTGSVVLGSDATPAVLIGDFERVEGTVETSDSRSVLDLYKMAVNLKFHEAKVLTRINVDYSGPLLAHGKKVYDELLKRQADLAAEPPSAISIFTGFHLLAKHFPFLYDPKFSTPPVPGLPTDRLWKGLARYRLPEDNPTPLPKTREEREYAKVTNLLEAPELDLTYYMDFPGYVPEPESATFVDDLDEIGNVDLPPDYGIDITITKGTIKYGPWADRQREALQKAFAPALFFDSEPKSRLEPGDARVHTNLVLRVMLEDETTLRIPTRESSKDWQYDSQPPNVERRYGWLDVMIGPNSSVMYTQDQIATARGYDSIMVLQLDSLAISSSVNLDTFIRAKTCKLSMAMPTPLQWNAQRDWGMDVVFDTPSINLLRDHVTLISDLAKDWSTGTMAGDYRHFISNHYNFRVSLINYAFHLYINDYNIVDAPGSRDANAFLDIYGPRLDAVVAVASIQYRPETSVVPFTITLSDARVELCVPQWDTHRTFGSDIFEVGQVGQLTASGSYRYYAVPHPDHQETLNLHLEGKHVKFKALGWVLRRMFCVKDNYFGGFTQFTTMHEFLERFDHNPSSVGDPVEEKYRPGRSDPFAVHLTMNIEESLILMSDEIYNCTSGIAVPVPQLQMTIKSVDQYMEMSLNATPTYAVVAPDLGSVYFKGRAPLLSHDEAVFVEGIEIKANRLFGSQPRATTYLCLWEVTILKVSGFLSPDMVATLQAVGRAVGYTYTDPDNAPDQNYQLKAAPDVTFLKLSVDQALVMLTSESDAVSVEAPSGLSLDLSTWGTRSYSTHLSVLLPSLTLNLLHRPPRKAWQVVSTATIGMDVNLYHAPTGWQNHVSAQQIFLKEQDRDTGRVWYMYQGGKRPGARHRDGLYLPMPMEEDVEETIVDDDSSSLKPLIQHDVKNVYYPQSSGDSSSDDDVAAGPVKRRRARSFLTAHDTVNFPLSPSTTVESDTTFDSASTAKTDVSSEPGISVGMPDVLAAKLQNFRFAHSRHIHDYRAEHPTDTGTSEGESWPQSNIYKHIESGKLLRLNTHQIQINLGPESVHTVSQIYGAIVRTKSSYEKRLDALLDGQIDAIAEGKEEKQPMVLDVRVPSINFLISSSDPLSTLSGHVAHSSCNIYRFCPEDDHQVFDMKSTVGSVSVTALSPSETPVSLRDVVGVSLGSSDSLPIAYLAISDLEVGLHKHHGTRIHGKVLDTSVHIVTPATTFGCTFINSWTSAFQKANFTTSIPNSDASMLRHILMSAVSSQRGDFLPSFSYVAPYGLHEQDSQLGNRRQTGWWLLARFRDWLRGGRLEEVNLPDPNHDDVERYVVDQLLQVDQTVQGTESLVREQPFFQAAFPQASPSPAETKSQPGSPLDVFIYAEGLCVSHYGRPLSSMGSVISLIKLHKSSLGSSMALTTVKGRQKPHVRLVGVVKEVSLELHDSVLAFAQQVVHLPSGISCSKAQQNGSEETPSKGDGTQANHGAMVVSLQVESIVSDIHGGGLRLHTSVRQLQLSNVSRLSLHSDSIKDSLNATCRLVEFMLLQPVDRSAALNLSTGRVILAFKTEGWKVVFERTAKHPNAEVRAIVGLHLVELDSRPQLRALYDFIQAWKAKELPLYASTVEDMKDAAKKWTLEPKPASTPIILTSLDVTIHSVHLQLRAAKALWLRWDIGKVYASRLEANKEIEFAVKIAPQSVGAHSSRKVKNSESTHLRLPSITTIGSHRYLDDSPHVFANIQIGVFTGVLRPAVLDRLLSLHQKLGEDIAELIQDFRGDVVKAKEKLRSKPRARDPSPIGVVMPSKILYDVHIGVDGVRFGLRAEDVPATVLVEALAIKGRATNQYHQGNGLHWRAKVDHFSLSLGHPGNHTTPSHDAEPLRRQRTASMTLDVEIEEIPATPVSTSQLIIHLSHVRTVMHVEALSELADLLRSWMSDLYILRDHRTAEVAEVKERTTKVLKKFEAAENVDHSEVSWLTNRLLTVEILSIGLAIPLVEGAVIDDGEHSTVPALLYSIRVISFQNRHNEVAKFKVQDMALQFVQNFDQVSPEYYTSELYGAKNCMLLPSIESEAQMSSSRDTWQLSAHCSATDFKLILSPDISDGILELIELFERGKEKIAKVEAQYKAGMAKHAQETLVSKYDDPDSPLPARKSQRVVVRTSFVFNSGTVELQRELSGTEKMSMSSETKKSKIWHDTVVLPTVSVWMEYTGPKFSASPSDRFEDDGYLLFNFAVHESRNVLRPTILPFFLQIAKRMRNRSQDNQSGPVVDPLPRATESTTLPLVSPEPEPDAPPPVRRSTTQTHLRVTLRIDKSELRLSCAPDSNAYADLKWASGGFMASTTIGGGSKATVAGSISGVTAYLRHEFAEGRSCIEAGARDLAFSVDCNHVGDSNQRSLSLVLDSQLSGQFRLEQFSAWLAFAAVWLEDASNIDIPSRPVPVEPALSSASASVPSSSTNRMVIAVLMRFRTVDFNANIGVTQARLQISPMVVRTFSNGIKTDLGFNLGVTQIEASGDISGNIRSERLTFHTTRQSSRNGAELNRTVLNMSMDAGTLSGNLSMQELSVISFALDPATVTLADDWRAFSQDPTAQVILSFAVKAGVLRSVVRLLAIPPLVNKFYSVSNTIDSQERMASHRSPAYKANHLRKSTEPSPMAAALLHTALSAGQPSSSSSAVKTAQNMRFDLGGIDIGLFNAPAEDDRRGDFYRFIIGKVEADLKRQVKDDLSKRELNLLVSYVEWISSDGFKAAKEVKKDKPLKNLIDDASVYGRKEIASLPLMTMTMDSFQELQPPVLIYDFDLVWGEGDLDIAIMPYFFEQFYKTFSTLIKGLDQEQVTKAKRRGENTTSPRNKTRELGGESKEEARGKDGSPDRSSNTSSQTLAFRRRLEGQRPLPVPRLRLLGEATGEAMAWVPKINSANAQLPVMVHRFVTSPLEDGMNLLLKLYEKQLPDRGR